MTGTLSRSLESRSMELATMIVNDWSITSHMRTMHFPCSSDVFAGEGTSKTLPAPTRERWLMEQRMGTQGVVLSFGTVLLALIPQSLGCLMKWNGVISASSAAGWAVTTSSCGYKFPQIVVNCWATHVWLALLISGRNYLITTVIIRLISMKWTSNTFFISVVVGGFNDE